MVTSKILDFDIYFMKICEDQGIVSPFQTIQWYTISIYVGEDEITQELSPHMGEPDLFWLQKEELTLNSLHICGELDSHLEFKKDLDDPTDKVGPNALSLGKN